LLFLPVQTWFKRFDHDLAIEIDKVFNSI
jgi:hypothetical protein